MTQQYSGSTTSESSSTTSRRALPGTPTISVSSGITLNRFRACRSLSSFGERSGSSCSRPSRRCRWRRSAETNLRIGGINHFAIEVADLDATVEGLQAKGVETVSPPRDVPNGGGDRFAFIADNEQMLVELFQPAQ